MNKIKWNIVELLIINKDIDIVNNILQNNDNNTIIINNNQDHQENRDILILNNHDNEDIEFVWYVNPKMTCPELFHVQVFAHHKL